MLGETGVGKRWTERERFQQYRFLISNIWCDIALGFVWRSEDSWDCLSLKKRTMTGQAAIWMGEHARCGRRRITSMDRGPRLCDHDWDWL